MKNKFINKRKKNFLIVYKNRFIFIFLLFLFLIYLLFHFNKFVNLSINYINYYSDKFDYNLSIIEISDLKYLEKNEILIFFKNYRNKSIFLIPIREIAKKIKNIVWVKNINIQSDYRNTLKIDIEEEIPYGIFNNYNQKLLFSNDLVVLKILKGGEGYDDLITFYGENSIVNSKKLLTNFNKEFIDTIYSATFIENRRWNIYLKNKILLKLPEKRIKEILENYKKIYVNFSNKDLKEIHTIDFRINGQAIIKYR